MTQQEWLYTVDKHFDVLKRLIQKYHPKYMQRDQYGIEITAPAPQQACDVVCEEIWKEKSNIDPVFVFTMAFNAGLIPPMYSILQEVWFGVPESTSCWKIPGFKEAVELLEDPPYSGGAYD